MTDAQRQDEKTFFDTLRSMILTSVPVLSALIFVVVSVKVFRAALMDTTTTVAIVSTADVVALLKGVILTLLPGFLAGLTATSIWWWAGVVPERLDRASADDARRALFAPQALWVWAMLVTAFFTVWWPVFLLLLIPVLATTAALVPLSIGRTTTASRHRGRAIASAAVVTVAVIAALLAGASWAGVVICLVMLVVLVEGIHLGRRPREGARLRLRSALRVFGLAAAATFIGLLALQPNVWLPLRTITFTGTPYTLRGKTLPPRVAAYVLSTDAQSTSLLLDHPRAVIEVQTSAIRRAMPLCTPPESRGRVLTTRASQVLGFDKDPHSPYDTCPDLARHLFRGG